MPEQTGYELLYQILNDVADALRQKLPPQEQVVNQRYALNPIVKRYSDYNYAIGSAFATLMEAKQNKCVMQYGSDASNNDMLFVIESDGHDVGLSDITMTDGYSTTFTNNSSNSVILHVFELNYRNNWADEAKTAITITSGSSGSFSGYSRQSMYDAFTNTVTEPITGPIRAQDFSTLIRSI